MPEFIPGEIRTAIAPMSNPTDKGFSYTAELYLGVTKVASSGVVSFSLAAGETRNISFPLTMPSTEGTHPVYLDIFSDGELIGAFQGTEDVTIISPVPTVLTYGQPSSILVPDLSASAFLTINANFPISNQSDVPITRTIKIMWRYWYSDPDDYYQAELDSRLRFELTLAPGQSYNHIFNGNYWYAPEGIWGSYVNVFIGQHICLWLEDDTGEVSPQTCVSR